MTAEIGILNKHGVVLAADSAVTISNGANSKVLNSARKLFTLSNEHSVGIMIYGNASFMGIPWDIIISEFKKSIGNNVLGNTAQYINTLIAFLLDFEPIQSQEALINYLTQQSHNYLELIAQEAQEEADERASIGETITRDIFNGIFREKIKQYSDSVSKLIKDDDFQFCEAELKVITNILENFVKNTQLKGDLKLKEDLDFLAQTIYKAISIGYDKNSVTGLVMAGYGNEEIFPSLRQIELNGIFAQRLVWEVINESEISQNNNCYIIPFAQSEMVNTIMNGIDPALNGFIAHEVSTLLEQNGIGDKQEELFETIANVQQSYYINPIFELIAMQPIDEMAFTAKTFIELTSFKRKIVNTLETVGGPIDVLAISKGDGPIWIERKHYFNIENNLDYKIRKGGI